jgi:hypothetical protein
MHVRFPKHTFLRSPSRHRIPRFLNLSRTALDLALIQLTRPTAPPRSLRRPGRCTAPTWFLTRGCRRSLRGQAVALAVHGRCGATPPYARPPRQRPSLCRLGHTALLRHRSGLLSSPTCRRVEIFLFIFFSFFAKINGTPKNLQNYTSTAAGDGGRGPTAVPHDGSYSTVRSVL